MIRTIIEFFNKVDPIVTVCTAVLTGYIAHKTHALSKKQKFKINCYFETISGTKNNITNDFLTFEFINDGIIDVYIENIYVKLNKSNYKISEWFHVKNATSNNSQLFPLHVTNNQRVVVGMEIGVLKKMNHDFVKNNNDERFKFIIVDGKGKEHKKIVSL